MEHEKVLKVGNVAKYRKMCLEKHMGEVLALSSLQKCQGQLQFGNLLGVILQLKELWGWGTNLSQKAESIPKQAVMAAATVA